MDIKTYTVKEYKAIADRDERVYTRKQFKNLLLFFIFTTLLTNYYVYCKGYNHAKIDMQKIENNDR